MTQTNPSTEQTQDREQTSGCRRSGEGWDGVWGQQMQPFSHRMCKQQAPTV